MIVLKYPVVGGEYKISQGFGTNPDGYPDFYKQFGYNGHNGIDIYGVQNDYIFAACDGRVSIAHFDSTGYGNLTVIVDDEGGQHYYAHQNAIAVKVGDIIKAGCLIGYMGNTGNVIGGPYSDGTHLHYGYRPAGYNKYNGYGGFIDPMPLFANEEVPTETQTESVPGWAEVVCDDGANVRESPGGAWKTWLPQGVRVRKTGETVITNGLPWEKLDSGLWVARSDAVGTVILKDVE